jgi:hypothetical protein
VRARHLDGAALNKISTLDVLTGQRSPIAAAGLVV